MAQTYTPFGGIQPAAATNTTLFTSPAATTTMLAMLTATTTTKSPNQQDDSIRIYVVPSGQVAADQYLIVCDMVVDAGDTYLINAPIVLAAGDFIEVYSQNGNIAFNGSGLELTTVFANENYLPFGGILPAAATPTVLFTAPAAKISTIGWLHACVVTKAGSDAVDDLIRLWIVPSGQSTAAPLDKYLVECDLDIDEFDPYMRNDLPVLNAGDSIVVYSLGGTVAFNGSALEIG